jgi:hypothetical protein
MSTNQLEDINERYTTAARKAGNLYLDSVEKAAEGVADLQKKLTEAYVSTTRELLA